MAITELRSPDPHIVCLADSITDAYEDSNRRSHMRLSPDDLRWLRSARVKYGPDVRVIDISAGGILVEAEGQLLPNTTIVFELSGPMNTILMPSRVLRCRVASFREVMLYQGACQFRRPLDIPDLVKQAKSLAPMEPAAPKAAAAAWQKVIARFLDGRLVRGYTTDFHPSKPQLHLSTEPHSKETVFLPLTQLKALFFVRDFGGNQYHIEGHDFITAPAGRKVVVTFHDGETLTGSTLGFRGERNGFFVQPADAKSNNLRVFVAPGAAQQVRFL